MKKGNELSLLIESLEEAFRQLILFFEYFQQMRNTVSRAEIIIISYHMTCFPWVWGSTLVHREKKLRFTNVLAPWTLTLEVRHPPRVKTRVSKEDQGTHRSKIKTFLGTAAPFIDFCLSRFVSRG